MLTGCVSVKYVTDSYTQNEGKKIIGSTEVYEKFIESDTDQFEDFLNNERKEKSVKGSVIDYYAKKAGYILSSLFGVLEENIGYISLIFFFIGMSIYIIFMFKNKKFQKRGLWIAFGFPVLFLIVVYGKPLIEALR